MAQVEVIGLRACKDGLYMEREKLIHEGREKVFNGDGIEMVKTQWRQWLHLLGQREVTTRRIC
ncbi:hypothetical protein SESBI_05841 [Sesbania bispinosa]|nr:hypothetical protein SESBI_05841 [Sesbania bispinosa]